MRFAQSEVMTKKLWFIVKEFWHKLVTNYFLLEKTILSTISLSFTLGKCEIIKE